MSTLRLPRRRMAHPTYCRREPFKRAIGSGVKSAVYPVLYYLLSKFPQLKKRAYVARYLLPLELPPEVLADEGMHTIAAQCHSQ